MGPSAGNKAAGVKKADVVLRSRKRDLEEYVDNNDDWILILQSMPEKIDDVNITTCRHPFCPATDHASQPSTHRISIERASNFEDLSPFSQRIPLRPQYPWSGNLKFGPRACEKRGLGKHVESWWCLECAENVWLELDGFIKPSSVGPQRQQPELYELFKDLQPESRIEGPDDRLYHLSVPQKYALEKWRAIGLYKAVKNYGIDPGPEAVSGAEPETLYLNPELRDLDGIDAVTGRSVLVTANDIAGKSLSGAMRLVDEEIEAQRQLCWEANNGSTFSTTEPSLEDENIKLPRGRLIAKLPVSERITDYLLAQAKLNILVNTTKDSSAPPLARTEVKPLFKKHAADAMTEEVMQASKKRRLGPLSHLDAPPASNPNDHKSPCLENNDILASPPEKVSHTETTAVATEDHSRTQDKETTEQSEAAVTIVAEETVVKPTRSSD